MAYKNEKKTLADLLFKMFTILIYTFSNVTMNVSNCTFNDMWAIP